MKKLSPQQIIDHIETKKALKNSEPEIKAVEARYDLAEILCKDIKNLTEALCLTKEHKEQVDSEIEHFKKTGEIKTAPIELKGWRKFWFEIEENQHGVYVFQRDRVFLFALCDMWDKTFKSKEEAIEAIYQKSFLSIFSAVKPFYSVS